MSDKVLYITDRVEELAQELMELTGETVSDKMNRILESELYRQVEQLKLQKVCDHPSMHKEKYDWWCLKCGLHLPDYVCEHTRTRETTQWGIICADCGETVVEPKCKHKNKTSYENGGWYCTDCKEILV